MSASELIMHAVQGAAHVHVVRFHPQAQYEVPPLAALVHRADVGHERAAAAKRLKAFGYGHGRHLEGDGLKTG
jgi:hypothetical protein